MVRDISLIALIGFVQQIALLSVRPEVPTTPASPRATDFLLVITDLEARHPFLTPCVVAQHLRRQ